MAERTLNGRSAVVTGSTSGIGLGIARALAAQGANVTLNGLEAPEEAESLRTEIEQTHGVKAVYDGADMMAPDQIPAMMARSREAFGAVDILVNNAGIQHVDSIEDFPAAKWDDILAINLSAVFHGTKAALPGMKERGWGRIINVSSVHGLVASVNKAAYVAAKHGVVGLTRVTALEAAGTGVTCNAICPGFVSTPLIERQIELVQEREGCSLDEARHRLVAEKQPSAQPADPAHIGELAAFLCSEAASQITGATQTIDGGWTAQ